ncbi:MAG: kinase [Elusimicrobiota bacterium]|jgi:D-glycero-alpha-D-manno-heptose-7-phosphate kinase
MVISKTPFRISFFGGGTDYPVWFKEHGGAVLSTTINKYCYITCRYLPPFFEHKSRVAYSKMEYVSSNEQIDHPSVRECLRFMKIQAGIEIHHDGDLPARTGLGSSSSFTVGLLQTLNALQQRMPSRMQLARDAIHVEQDMIQENVGCQDQVAVALGGFNKIVFHPSGEITPEPIVIRNDRFQHFQDHLVMIFSGFARNASAIAAKQISNTPKKHAELSAMRKMVDEAVSILTGSGPLDDLGKLLHESWMLKRSLADNISMPDVDRIYEAGLKHGALGGKLLGAGGGGFLLFFVRPQERARLLSGLDKLLHIPFRFENSGSTILFYDPSERESDFLALKP